MEEVKQMEIKKAEPLKADGRDRIFAVLYFLVAYGFISAFTSFRGVERNIAAFTVLYTAVVLVYVTVKGVKPPRESYFWLLVVLAIGISYAFWSILYLLQVLALMIAAAYWTLSVTGRLIGEGKTSQWIFHDLMNAGFLVPFGNFGCQWKLALNAVSQKGSEEAGRSRRKQIYSVLLGVVLVIPILLIVVPLLSSADAGFEAFMGNISVYISDHLMEGFVKFLFSLPVGAYLFGLIYGGISGRNAEKYSREKLESGRNSARIIPDVTIYTVLTILCLLYCLFIWLQAGYLFSAFAGIRPEGLTYSAYARRGFFELCAIGAFNLLILLGTGLTSEHGREHNPGLRVLNVVLSVLTLLLLLTAMSKMGMYMDVYGLTVNRILPMTFMLWMALVFISFTLRQWKCFPMVRICVIAGAVLFVLLCVIPVERLVLIYNEWARAAGMIQ